MADEKIEVLNQDGTTSYVDVILDMEDASRERTPMSKRVAIEFAEAPEFQRELTEAEAQKYGIKVSEEATPLMSNSEAREIVKASAAVESDQQIKSMAESYKKLGLTETEATLAAGIDLGL
ncbi:MAG TPA: hypothetical protein VFA85_18665 [Terriglobales bacterium]|nr:hypothetical protein [Terriglobales bacterium]